MTLILALLAITLLGASVALVAWATALPRLQADKRIGLIADYGRARILGDTTAEGSEGGALDGLAQRLGDLAGRALGARDQDLRRELMAAGLYKLSPAALMGYRVLAAGAMPLLFATIAPQAWPAPLRVMMLAYGVYAGWSAPLMIVRRRARARLDEIDLKLPDMIELIVVTVEAGLGFNASLQAASEKLDGPLANELRLMLQEQRMGLSNSEALRNMAQRADTPAMRSFSRAVLQGQELGVSIGHIMRALAVDMRKIRRAKAEERAHKAPVKMLFPMVFLLFPAMFLVLLGPAAMQLTEAFGSL